MLGLTVHLTERESPIVRVLGSWELDRLYRERPDLEGEGRKIRASALKDGWSDPAVVLNVYGADCVHGRSTGDCDPSAVQARMLRIAPDNAVATLMPWLYPVEKSPKALELNDRNVATLAEAAEKESFDLYVTAGVYDVYQEIERYEFLQEQPKIPQELLTEFNERGFWPPNDPMWSPSATILFAAFAYNGRATFSRLTDFCGLAESKNHAEAVRACLDLADLMQGHSKTFIAELLGNSLRKKIERPKYVGSTNELQDPDRWRDQIRRLVFDCARPRIIGSFFSFEQMPADHWSTYVRELQESGERVASQRAADREYAEFPELYELDPADCARIHELDEETQKRLAREYETKLLGDVLRALDNGTVIDLSD
jgi:hypothetical protein